MVKYYPIRRSPALPFPPIHAFVPPFPLLILFVDVADMKSVQCQHVWTTHHQTNRQHSLTPRCCRHHRKQLKTEQSQRLRPNVLRVAHDDRLHQWMFNPRKNGEKKCHKHLRHHLHHVPKPPFRPSIHAHKWSQAIFVRVNPFPVWKKRVSIYQ